MERIKFLNTHIDNVTMKEAVLIIEKLIKKSDCAYAVSYTHLPK